MHLLRRLGSTSLDPALDHRQQRGGNEPCSGGLLKARLQCRAEREQFPHTRFQTISQNARGGTTVCSHQGRVEMLRTTDMRQEIGGIDSWRIAGGSANKGGDDALKLGAQQIVFGSVVSVKGGASHACFPGDLADANVAVGTTVEQIDEGGIDSRPSTSNPLVFANGSTPLRDACRFLFCNCHRMPFSVALVNAGL